MCTQGVAVRLLRYALATSEGVRLASPHKLSRPCRGASSPKSQPVTATQNTSNVGPCDMDTQTFGATITATQNTSNVGPCDMDTHGGGATPKQHDQLPGVDGSTWVVQRAVKVQAKGALMVPGVEQKDRVGQ